jgi:hypothetical protein
VAISLAMAILVVYIRLAVKKEPVEIPFSGFRKKDDEDGAEEPQKPKAMHFLKRASLGTPLLSRGLMMPAAPGAAEAKSAKAGAVKPKLSLADRIMAVKSGIIGLRKNKLRIAEEVKAIDKEINQVLKESQEIDAPGGIPEIALGTSVGQGLNSMEEIKVLIGGKDLSAPVVPENVKFGLREDSIKLEDAKADNRGPGSAPAGSAGGAPQANNSPASLSKPAEEAKKPEAAKSMENLFGGKGTDSLLDEIASETAKEEDIDLSIMKEFKDMPIACEDLEIDLKGILDRIAIDTTDAGGKKQKA